MKSTHGEIIVVALGVVGALAALGIGLLTFGAQATAAPHHVPLAVGASDASLTPIADRVASEGGDAVSWRTIGSRDEAVSLLDRKEIYGALLFERGPAGPTATVLVSGALNPGATQVAQPLLTQVAVSVGAAAATRIAVQVVTVHPTSAAGRIFPLAASALLWLATLITSVLVVVSGPRVTGGRPLGRTASIAGAVSGAVLGAGVALGLGWLWDHGLPLGWEVAGFLGLVGLAFALLQGGVLRWLGVRGVALVAPLYLMAPAVAGLPPELLDPVYRTALWSWTPFRFSTEGLRSLLFLGSGATDVATALWVFAGIALAGLLLLLTPRPRPRAAVALHSAGEEATRA